jgi:hypothetical protein
MTRKHSIAALGLVSTVLATSTFAAETSPPARPEVTAAMQPYLDGYKLAGVIGIIADKSGDQWAARDLFLKTAAQVFSKSFFSFDCQACAM